MTGPRVGGSVRASLKGHSLYHSVLDPSQGRGVWQTLVTGANPAAETPLALFSASLPIGTGSCGFNKV